MPILKNSKTRNSPNLPCFSGLGNYRKNVALTFSGASNAIIAGTIAFTAATLMHLATEELLMEAHEVEERPISILVLFEAFSLFGAFS